MWDEKESLARAPWPSSMAVSMGESAVTIMARREPSTRCKVSAGGGAGETEEGRCEDKWKGEVKRLTDVR